MSVETFGWCALAVFSFSAALQLFGQVRREWYFPAKKAQNFIFLLAVVGGLFLGTIALLRFAMELGLIAKF